MTASRISGLYVIADTGLLPAAGLIAAVDGALRGGARLLQYRNKLPPDAARRDEARQLRALARQYGVPFLVNDDVALAIELGADGVHLGRDDTGIAEARARLGPDLLIGASCYNDLPLARAARDAGADYVAFGSFHPSPTKPAATPATPALLHEARAVLDLPLVAIGGITPDNGGALLDAGADALAVISGVLGQADPEAAARRYVRLRDPVPELGSMNRRTR